MTKPTAHVIAYSKFLGVPEELAEKGVRPDQDQGTDLARLVETAGRCCYDSFGGEKTRGSDTYHKHILEVGHGSVLEHSSISFFITNVSRGLTHELVRHRVGVGISQRSTRYVDEAESPWIWHPLVDLTAEWLLSLDDPVLQNDGRFIRHGMEDVQQRARSLYGWIVNGIQKYLESQGTDKFTARKQARGAARGALGNALMTELVWTANIRSLRHFLEMRASAAADAEIRLLANALYEAALPVIPEYLQDYEKVECPDGIGYAVRTKYRKV